MRIRKCALCGVEFWGSPADHDCDRDGWAKPVPQPESGAGGELEGVLADIAKAGVECG